jgi:hypothetical protein
MSKTFKTLLGGGLTCLFSLVAISLAEAQTCVQAASGLVSWWPGDGNADDIQNGNDGTLQNGATFAAGMVGPAFSLDGVDDFVEIPDAPNLKPSRVSVDAWVKFSALDTPNASGPGLQYIVFKKNTRMTNFEGYTLLKFRSEGADRFFFEVSSAQGVAVAAVSNTAVQTGKFYHVAGTYDGSDVKLYVDGVLEDEQPATFPLDYDTRPVFIGTSGEFFFDGKLQGLVDEVEIFNRALSAAEIQAIFNAGSAGKCKASTVLDHFKCYKAKGASPNVAVDLEDQFGVEPEVLVEQPKLFCNPVDKNGEEIRNPAAHLTCYKINADGENRDVVVENQFGGQTLEVEKPKLLCVPSDKIDVIP